MNHHENIEIEASTIGFLHGDIFVSIYNISDKKHRLSIFGQNTVSERSNEHLEHINLSVINIS
jgi:hypothetical protein